ncbi:MAG: aminofutalosine synthase MqnE [Desulfohalobiaceae bacterium]|nr:aminofutalosine synthase MqnE [Desulfohalobiaceae bacterium]
MIDKRFYKKYGFSRIYEKILSGERLSLEEGDQLYACPDPGVPGSLAHLRRRSLHGSDTTYVLNQQLNYTNICVNHCSFCSYHRTKKAEGAFEFSLEDVRARILSQAREPITEIHCVGGCHPELPLSFYEDMLQLFKELRPGAVLKCFTAVEIEHFAKREKISTAQVLSRLKAAGLDMMPGGGAEIFAPEIRERICPQKISGRRWLDICQEAHEMGIKTNCTMLFGHLEERRHRLEHLDLLRRLQDRTGGFLCFIPLPFQTSNNSLKGIAPLSGIEELKTIAVSRLMLDNIPNIKSYWVMLGLKQAQAALFYGANDLDGTVVEEKIGHMAGADSPQVLSRSELEGMIRGCGLNPVQRNGFFEAVGC